MNKKEITLLKKEFNEDTYKLKFGEIYSFYIKKDNFHILCSEKTSFDAVESERRQLYLKNFKKILSGTLDTKLCELEFKKEEQGNHSEKILYEMLKGKENQEEYEKFVEKFSDHFTYESDVVLTFIKGEYFQNTKQSKKGSNEEEAFTSFEFVMGSVNKICFAEKDLRFHFEEQKWEVSSEMDGIVELNTPIEGFMFPTLEGGYTNINKVLYYNSKTKDKSSTFIEEVLNCQIPLTAQEEKEAFTALLGTVTEGQVTSNFMQGLYFALEEVATAQEEEDRPRIGIKELEKILKKEGIAVMGNLEELCEEVMNCSNPNFKVDNILPKTVKISNKNAQITLSPKELDKVTCGIDAEGRPCLLIAMEEAFEIEGMRLTTE